MAKDMKVSFAEFEQIREVYNGTGKVMFFSALPTVIYSKIYHFLNVTEDMPYGTQKGRDGDPEEWLFDQFEIMYDKELRYD